MERTEQSIKGVGTEANTAATATFTPAREGRLRFGQKQFKKKIVSKNIPKWMKEFNRQISKAQQIPKMIFG